MSEKPEHPLLPRIRELRASGHSFARIGALLGQTKNQVIGIWARAGLQDPANNPIKGPRRRTKGNDRWSMDEEATLLRLVGEGRTDAEIGAALNRKPGQVAMHLHRLRLRGVAVPQRVSQVREKSRSPASAQTIAPEAVPAPLPARLASVPSDVPPGCSAVSSPVAAPPAPAVGGSQPSRPRAAFSGGAARCCQWPSGHPREPGFRFCEAPLPVGAPSSYCSTHHAIAYVRRPVRDEVAA